MHSAVQRVNVLLTFFGTTAALLCVLTSLSDVVHRSNPSVSVTLDEVKRLGPAGSSKEQAYITFSVDADLRSVFSWNTKQLFVFLQAEYVSKENKVNQVVLWDTILTSKDAAVLRLHQQRCKYAFVDRFKGLKGAAVNLTLAWNIMPHVGYLSTQARTFNVGRLPDEYVL